MGDLDVALTYVLCQTLNIPNIKYVINFGYLSNI